MSHLEATNDNQDGRFAITIYSDVICPWCYVGKRRFEVAAGSPGMPERIEISWRPFELNPDMPVEGMDRAAYRLRKFGADKAREIDERMAEVGREIGISFAFDKMKRTPNTRLAHRLIWQAEREGSAAQNGLVDLLFRSYFEEGRDIGSKSELLALAGEAGLDVDGARRALEDDAILDAVLDLEDQAIRMGVQGVPFFLVVNKYAISGAQPPELWRDALPQIAAELQGATG
ncbi:MAG: DsbA family protein [Hyphomicrobiaceae bacterium]